MLSSMSPWKEKRYVIDALLIQKWSDEWLFMISAEIGRIFDAAYGVLKSEAC